MAVVVVESPAKAKTINKYLGSDYTVLASYGHVRDLPPKDGSVRPDEDFAMDWEVDSQSQKRIDAIAQALKDGLGENAQRVSTRVLPDWLVRFAARFSATARQAATAELGRSKNATSAKAQAMLGWQPRPPNEALVATGESLIRFGLVSPRQP